MEELKIFLESIGGNEAMIEEFVKGLPVLEINNCLFATKTNASKNLVYSGEKIGEVSKGRKGIGQNFFVPSQLMLKFLEKNHEKINYVVVNEKTAWLFICKKDVLEEGVIDCSIKKRNMALVLNEKKECLGYGRIVKDKIFLKNIYDIGEWLRREKSL